MKKEELFKAMSDLDQDIVAETRDEGIEVSPIRVTESKRKFSYKPIIAAAASCALIAGTAAAVINGAGQTVVNVPAQYTNETVNDIGEPSVWQSAYPESAKYQYKGDYSGFKSFTNPVCIDFVKWYTSYRDLLNDSDLAVVGEFVDDPWQDVDPNVSADPDNNDDIFLDCSSYNTFRIDCILTPNGSTAAESGSEIVISQPYAVRGDTFSSHSKLTPMLKGDRWVYFLVYNEGENTYYPLNDYMGRYPDPYYYQVLDRDPNIKDSANTFLPFMTNKYGLINENDFNENIYRTLADILYHEYMPHVQCLYDSESSGLYNVTSFEMAEFANVLFNITEGVLYADEPWSSVGQNGRAIIGGDMAKISKLFLIDLNGDSNNEICAEVHWDYGSGVSGSCIYILDYAQKQYYTVSGEVGKTEYYLGERDGDLIAFKTQFRSDGDRGQTLSDEKLALDMADCFAHINMRGHSAYCIQDSLYCGQQEGECPYTGNHHEEASGEHHEEEPDEHHGHSEYCLQNADYCAQQDGKCPYRPDDLEDMPIVIQGHNEHCLEDADYCSQQEGECPYTGGHHNEEPEHHGHSEYCLQDANYCSQQEGECPYKQSGHHGEDHSSEHGGHH